MLTDSSARRIRKNLDKALKFNLTFPNADLVRLIYAPLTTMVREGERVSASEVAEWARAAGWTDDDIAILTGIVLVAEFATPDFGSIATTRSPDDRLVVHLTEDEARVAAGAGWALLNAPLSEGERAEAFIVAGHPKWQIREVVRSLYQALGSTKADSA